MSNGQASAGKAAATVCRSFIAGLDRAVPRRLHVVIDTVVRAVARRSICLRSALNGNLYMPVH